MWTNVFIWISYTVHPNQVVKRPPLVLAAMNQLSVSTSGPMQVQQGNQRPGPRRGLGILTAQASPSMQREAALGWRDALNIRNCSGFSNFSTASPFHLCHKESCLTCHRLSEQPFFLKIAFQPSENDLWGCSCCRIYLKRRDQRNQSIYSMHLYMRGGPALCGAYNP